MDRNMEPNGKASRILVIMSFIIFGGLIGAATYVSLVPESIRTGLKVGAAIVSLVAWLIFSRDERLRPYKQIAISFFSISLGVVLAHYLGNTPLKFFGASIATAKGVALAKFGESLPVILSILAFHFVTGGDINGLFLGRGNLKLGLISGVIGFAAFAGIGVLQVLGSGLRLTTVAQELPWILTFIFCNAFMEELWFRASFLKKLGPLVGDRTALVITSLVFAGVHISSTYVTDILIFMAAVMALGLLWGWLMQKSDSLWGAVLIHAGGDVLAILGFLAGANL